MPIMTSREREIWACRLYSPGQEEAYALRLQLCEGKLGLWEDAHALAQYIRLSGDTQSECARRIGRSPSAVANRLRLLKLPDDIFRRLCDEGLTERHARALLRLSCADEQRSALAAFLRDRMTVAEAESYAEKILSGRVQPETSAEESLQNRWLEELRELRQLGICSSIQVQEGPDTLTLMLRFPKKPISGEM